MGRYVDQRLEELGGERMYVRGEGDDDAKLVIVGRKKQRERERDMKGRRES